jgi:3-isopropylmalate dehydrogenase
MGMLASASLGDEGVGVYEPIHGSAPDIAGQLIANPLATILSTALLLRYALGLEDEAQAVEDAVRAVLENGYRTPDIAGTTEGSTPIQRVNTPEMGDAVIAALA